MSVASTKIKKGFNYDEALLLSNFAKQVYDIFQYDDGSIDDSEIKDIYNTLNRNLGWQLVYTVRNDETNVRGFILKKTGVHQYAVVFRGTIITDRGLFEFTDVISDFSNEFVSYGSTTDSRVKVSKGFFEAFESVAVELRLFFKTILGRLTIKDFLQIKGLKPLRQFAAIQALADAGGIRLGVEFEQEVRKLIYDALVDGEIGNNEELEKILEYKTEKLLALEPLGEPIDVYVAGHSLGGALAQLAALDLRRQFGSPLETGFTIKVYTIGATKVGNKNFADYYNQQIPKGFVYRIENLLDPVIQVPLSPPFPLSIFASGGLRLGNFYLANTVPVGEVHTVMGLGSQSISLGFGAALEFGGGVPFPHSYDTYISLLQEDRQRWTEVLKPVETVLRPFFEDIIREQFEQYIVRSQAANQAANQAAKD